MKKIILSALTIAMLALGLLFFFYQQSWIILAFPWSTSMQLSTASVAGKSVPVELFAYKQNQWIRETTEIMQSKNTAQTLQALIGSWFLFLEEEQLIDSPILVETIILSQSGQEAFISLSQSPLRLQASTYEACMTIQGLLKTISANQIPVERVRFLVHHKPLRDHRLNFDFSWPIAGYLGTI